MKKHILLPLLTLVAGGAGFYLNYKLQTVSLNPLTQLLVADSPYPTLLMSLTLGFAALVFLLLCQGVPPTSLQKAYATPPTATIALWMAGGLLLIFGGGMIVPDFLSALDLREAGLSSDFSFMLLVGAALSLPACVGLLVLCKHLSKGNYTNTIPLMTLFPSFVTLSWLLYCYQANTINPVSSLYGYQLLGLVFATLGLYLVPALAYLPHSPRPKTAIFCSLMGSYLLITTLSTGQEFYVSLSHQAMVLILFGNAIVMLKNMQYPHPELDEHEM